MGDKFTCRSTLGRTIDSLLSLKRSFIAHLLVGHVLWLDKHGNELTATTGSSRSNLHAMCPESQTVHLIVSHVRWHQKASVYLLQVISQLLVRALYGLW